MCVYNILKIFQWFNYSVIRFHGSVPCSAKVFLLEVNQPCLKIRIVSMPCWELFDEQDQEYQALRWMGSILATLMKWFWMTRSVEVLSILEYWIYWFCGCIQSIVGSCWPYCPHSGKGKPGQTPSKLHAVCILNSKPRINRSGHGRFVPYVLPGTEVT